MMAVLCSYHSDSGHVGATETSYESISTMHEILRLADNSFISGPLAILSYPILLYLIIF